MSDVGQKIRSRRRASSLSQRALAGLAGVGQNMIVRVEQGYNVRLSTLAVIARSLGLEIRLVPRELTATIDEVIRAHEGGEDLAATLQQPMYTLDDDDE